MQSFISYSFSYKDSNNLFEMQILSLEFIEIVVVSTKKKKMD